MLPSLMESLHPVAGLCRVILTEIVQLVLQIYMYECQRLLIFIYLIFYIDIHANNSIWSFLFMLPILCIQVVYD